eukprot:m.36619 g.36619  ORF g.36619 m.36619 type:complete len:86 (-) comp10025_c0_seq3:13-270(-)
MTHNKNESIPSCQDTTRPRMNVMHIWLLDVHSLNSFANASHLLHTCAMPHPSRIHAPYSIAESRSSISKTWSTHYCNYSSDMIGK